MTRRTVERRKEREQEKKRNRQRTILLAVGLVAILAVALIALLSLPAEAPIPEKSVAPYADLERSNTDQGFPRIGNPDAPVSVFEYSSFGCPGCKAFHDTAMDDLMERVRTGAVVFTYVPLFNNGSLTNREGAARAAVCANEQGKFWEYHDALFSWHGLYAMQAFTANRMRAGAEALGLDVGAWQACATDARSQTIINAAESTAALQNITSTPSIVVNGIVVSTGGSIDELVTNTFDAIDRAIESGGLPPVVEATPETTAEATAESTPEAAAEATTEATAEATP
jgi:protein-disulfide isomerase